MREPERLTAVKFCHASYAADPISRNSARGLNITLDGMMTNWSSSTINTTILISRKSKYISLKQCVQELKFVCMLL